jgi:hypothetical protein
MRNEPILQIMAITNDTNNMRVVGFMVPEGLI